MIDFTFRVIDLLEILLKKERDNAIILGLILPILNAIQQIEKQGKDSKKPLHQKINITLSQNL